MPEEQVSLISNSLEILLNYGVLGLFSIILMFVCWKLWKKMEEMHTTHGVRIDEFTTVMKKHSENEAVQTELMRDLKNLLQTQLTK